MIFKRLIRNSSGPSGQNGFTLIELVIVLVILSVLVSVVAVAHNGVIQQNRNKQREADILNIQGELETYYAQHTLYPTLANLNNSSWVGTNMKDLPSGSLQDPGWSTSVLACTSDSHSIVIKGVAANCYSYQVISTDGSNCDNNHKACAHYTLTAMLSSGVKYVVSSLN